MPKIILDLCGGTGSWSKPYRDAGYDVRLITLPAWDVSKVEFNRHGMEFIRQDVGYVETMTVLYEDVYGILAAPPCTEFSLAKKKNGRQRDFKQGMDIVKSCMEIIWRCRQDHKIFWALENPVGLLRQFLGRPKYTIRQWQFGALQAKPTDIWGYFNPPHPTVKDRPDGITKRYSSGKLNTFAWSAPCPEEYKHLNLDRAAIRAITPPGFAQAFFRANR